MDGLQNNSAFRRSFNMGASALLFVMIMIAAFPSASTTPSPPNIVFILADDLGWYDVGFHGSEIKTPNIDKLAREGVILNNYFVQPICTPTRASILTGKYPIHTGLQHYVIVGSQPYGLPLKEKTLAQHLKSRGYSTHAVGKWHLGFFKEDYLPTHRGFDSHLGYYLGKEDYFNHSSLDGNFYGYDFHQNGKTLWHEDGVYSTHLFSSQADTIIKSHNKSKPLFLYLAHQAVHSGNRADPIQVPQKYIDRFPYIKNLQRRKFAGVVSALDDSVGQVYQSLQDAGLSDNTILVFTTDNGGPTNGMDHNAACNWPLRGGKETLWQGGVRGVGFVHSPLMARTGYINNNKMHVVDWLPTLLSSVDASTSPSSSSSATLGQQHANSPPKPTATFTGDIDGISQWDSISKNGTETRQEVLLNIDPIEGKEGIVIGHFKLLKGQYDHGKFDGWYPPLSGMGAFDGVYGLAQPDLNADYKGIFNAYMKSFDKDMEFSRMQYPQKFKRDAELDELMGEMNEEYEYYIRKSGLLHSGKDLNPIEAFHVKGGGDLRVDCGPKPANASTNCHLKHKPCLFHLTADPCEYNNLARDLPGIVAKLEARLNFYRSTMIPPGNKPVDPNGNPQLHGGVWKPWM